MIWSGLMWLRGIDMRHVCSYAIKINPTGECRENQSFQGPSLFGFQCGRGKYIEVYSCAHLFLLHFFCFSCWTLILKIRWVCFCHVMYHVNGTQFRKRRMEGTWTLTLREKESQLSSRPPQDRFIQCISASI